MHCAGFFYFFPLGHTPGLFFNFENWNLQMYFIIFHDKLSFFVNVAPYGGKIKTLLFQHYSLRPVFFKLLNFYLSGRHKKYCLGFLVNVLFFSLFLIMGPYVRENFETLFQTSLKWLFNCSPLFVNFLFSGRLVTVLTY